MEDKPKLSKAKGMEMCVNLMVAGKTRKDIITSFTQEYVISVSAIEKWMRAARPIVEDRLTKPENPQPGRPALFKTPEEMEGKLTEYFEWVKGERVVEVKKSEGIELGELDEWVRYPEPITITGLCIFLGFESRQSFYDYEERDGFSYIIQKARLLVENGYEKRLHGQHVSGPIFALKNMGWKDRSEQNVNLSAVVWNETKTYDPDEKTD